VYGDNINVTLVFLLRCSWQVIFVGEEAVDAGGVRKEFFLLIMRELLDPKYGMFRYHEESRLIWFSNKVSTGTPKPDLAIMYVMSWFRRPGCVGLID
jgi:hypothetical protein